MADHCWFEFRQDPEQAILYVTVSGVLDKTSAVDLIKTVNDTETFAPHWDLIIDFQSILEVDIPVRELFAISKIAIEKDRRTGSTVMVVGNNDGRYSYGKLLEYALNKYGVYKLTIANTIEQAQARLAAGVGDTT